MEKKEWDINIYISFEKKGFIIILILNLGIFLIRVS